jgi:hypothetical protein
VTESLVGMTSIPRRTVLGAAAAGLVFPSVATHSGPRPGVAGLLSLFRATPVVALNEGVHHLQDSWDFLAAAMFQPGFDAVVIELGNSRHQTVADDYVNGGVVRRSHLQRIWRDTTQSPAATGDISVLHRVLGLARTINLCTSRSMRVLLADPPIDWAQVHDRDDHNRFLSQRSECWADVIVREVLDKGQRCVTIGGGLHFFRNLPFLGMTPPGVPPPDKPSVSEMIEQEHPDTVSVVHTHAIATAEVERCVAGWARPSIAATSHTGYGRMPAAAIIGGLSPEVADRLDGLTVADLADHVLFLGRRRDLTAAVPEWEVFHEPTYWAELQRRKEITGVSGDLATLRLEAEPAMFPQER